VSECPCSHVLLSKPELQPHPRAGWLSCIDLDVPNPNLPFLQVFNILPLYGELQPGESQQVTFTFFGHANLVVHVTALCEVQGGPTYEVMLSGEASVISYLLDATEIDCGLQVPQLLLGLALIFSKV